MPAPSSDAETSASDSATHRPRNRRGQGARLRADILRAAAELLEESRDQNAVTLRAVARRIGIAAPSIYGHFANPQAILLAIVQEAFDELLQHLRAARADAGPDPAARLRAISQAYLDFSRKRPQRYRVMFGGLWNAADAVHDEEVAEADVVALGQEVLQILAVELQECVATGRSSSTDPVADSVALWVSLHGLAHQRVAAPLFPWPRGIAERLVTALAGLRPQE